MFDLYKTFVKENIQTVITYVTIICVLSSERVAIPHVYGKLLDSLRSAKFDSTTKYFAIIVSIFVVFQILDTTLTYIDATLMPRFEAFVRKHVVDVIIDSHSEHYAELDLGNITSKLIKLPANLNILFYRIKAFLFNHVLSVMLTVGYLYYCHWSLGTIFTAAFAILGLLTWNFCDECSRPSYVRDKTFDDMQESIQDILYNLQSVHISRAVDTERQNIERLNAHTVNKMRDWVFCGLPYRMIFAVLFLSVFVGVTGLSIWLYRKKKMTLALMVSSFMVTFSILRTCIHFYYDFENFVYVHGSMQVVSDYIDSLPDNKRGTKGILETSANHPTNTNIDCNLPIPVHPHRQDGGIDIVIDNVMYIPELKGNIGETPFVQDKEHETTHHTAVATTTTSLPVFKGVTISIPSGQHVAIVGSIGSGKSTLAHLLLKFKSPTAGTIKYNGVSIDRLSVNSVREAVYYVPQTPRLFNRTLWENIRYGNTSDAFNPDDVYRLLHKLKMDALAEVFRQKMYKHVGKQGSYLSGGQRQIVLLLRAIFNTDAKVIILDEPTSALDSESSDQVLRIIQSVSKGRTLIVITHDKKLATLADRVVVMGR